MEIHELWFFVREIIMSPAGYRTDTASSGPPNVALFGGKAVMTGLDRSVGPRAVFRWAFAVVPMVLS